MRLARLWALAVIGLLASGASIAQAQTTGAVVGTVADAQGATVPGATVALISESRGTSIDTQSAGTGDFIFPSVLPDTYTVRISVDGFKTLERRNVAVSPGDRVVVGTMTIELQAFRPTARHRRWPAPSSTTGSSQASTPAHPARGTTRPTRTTRTAAA
jgi:Carboxypeptidase regulatory-like domain